MQVIEFAVDETSQLIEIYDVYMGDPGFEEQLEIGREFMRKYADILNALAKNRK
jgi:hypothetical protein